MRIRGHDYSGIEPKPESSRFALTHRSYIVNLDQIVSIEPLEADARVHMLPFSRRYRNRLRDRI